MSFPLNLYFLAAVGALGTALLALPAWRAWCLRTGLVDDPGHRKIHHQPVPLAGGLAVLTALLVPLGAGAALLLIASRNPESGFAQFIHQLMGRGATSPIAYGLGRRWVELTAIAGGAGGMWLLGWLDDKHELGAGMKFAGQFLIASLVALAGVRITLFVPSLVFSLALTVLWILTLVNALNFMDNMNGLCAGLGAISAWYFAWLAAGEGQYLVALIAFMAFGALLGFLPYNFPDARSFLGDSGSHLVGYLMAILAILPHFHTPISPRPWAVLIPLLVLAVPLLDLAWVVGLRWRLGQPVYVGDTNHLSHRLVRRGHSRTRAVLLIWLLAAVSGAAAMLLAR